MAELSSGGTIAVAISVEELSFILHGYEERRARFGVEKRRASTTVQKAEIQEKLDQQESRYRELDALLDQHSVPNDA